LNESYFNFWERLEAANCMDWLLEFFYFDKGCNINPRFEKLDTKKPTFTSSGFPKI
jgi:hypothetical protein